MLRVLIVNAVAVNSQLFQAETDTHLAVHNRQRVSLYFTADRCPVFSGSRPRNSDLAGRPFDGAPRPSPELVDFLILSSKRNLNVIVRHIDSTSGRKTLGRMGRALKFGITGLLPRFNAAEERFSRLKQINDGISLCRTAAVRKPRPALPHLRENLHTVEGRHLFLPTVIDFGGSLKEMVPHKPATLESLLDDFDLLISRVNAILKRLKCSWHRTPSFRN